ncbi:MAG: hypothetical protein ACAI43_00310 [Phycisphaerae bacterium]|nr:hypothetical protein [Tepidisphaeraceae bacterium]
MLRLDAAIVDWLPLEYARGDPDYDVYAEPDFGWVKRRTERGG